MEKKKAIRKVFLILVVLLYIAFAMKLLPFISLGEDNTTIEVKVDLKKYVNYDLSEKQKGTLVQYEISTKVDSEVNESETTIHLAQINGQYPYEAKTLTNDRTQYDPATGTLLIQADGKSEANHLVVCYYNTYTSEDEERALEIKVNAKAKLANDEETEVSNEEEYSTLVTQNIGKLTSINYNTEEIYNGYIKSNIMNGTDYTTQYEQKEQIIVSKKEAQDTIEMVESNSFIKQTEDTEEEIDLGNNQNLVYKSTQIQKEEIKRLLGDDGTIEILDIEQNVIATIDQDTEFSEDGTLNITYEDEPEVIILKTSHIVNEGILNLNHTKEIKSTMTDFQNISIKTAIQMVGQEDTYETRNELKEAQTTIETNISSATWSNQQQNEVTFDIHLNATTSKNNMFKNPSLRMELPNQVEKVLLQNSGIFYGNGLELQEVYTETNSNGNTVVVANLVGEQVEYSENALGLSTEVKIGATIILKKDMDTQVQNINVECTNQYTVDGSVETARKEIPVELESYQGKAIEEEQEQNQEPIVYSEAQPVTANVDDLKLEVAPVKGDVALAERRYCLRGRIY